MTSKLIGLSFFSLLIVSVTTLGVMKYIEPPRVDIQVGDCFNYDIRDMAYWTGYSTFGLRVHDIRVNEYGAELILFRPINHDYKYYDVELKDHLKDPMASYDSTGLVWLFRRDFERSMQYQRGEWVRSAGYSRFSWGEGESRNGIQCNPLRND